MDGLAQGSSLDCAMPPHKRLRSKTPDPSLQTKSLNPKKLKRAKKKLLQNQKDQRDGSSASTPASASAPREGLVTLKGKIRKALSFEMKKNEVFDIQAENEAPGPAKKGLASVKQPAMSVNEADEILKTMHTDLA